MIKRRIIIDRGLQEIKSIPKEYPNDEIFGNDYQGGEIEDAAIDFPTSDDIYFGIIDDYYFNKQNLTCYYNIRNHIYREDVELTPIAIQWSFLSKNSYNKYSVIKYRICTDNYLNIYLLENITDKIEKLMLVM